MQIEKILILGAGAIGQVIGTHLRLSGCDVSFWVRPYQVEQFKDQGQGIYAHVELEKGERSQLAELAAEVLK